MPCLQMLYLDKLIQSHMGTLQILKESYDQEKAIELEKNRTSSKIVVKVQPTKRVALVK